MLTVNLYLIIACSKQSIKRGRKRVSVNRCCNSVAECWELKTQSLVSTCLFPLYLSKVSRQYLPGLCLWIESYPSDSCTVVLHADDTSQSNWAVQLQGCTSCVHKCTGHVGTYFLKLYNMPTFITLLNNTPHHTKECLRTYIYAICVLKAELVKK